MEREFKNDDEVLFENRDMLLDGGLFSDCPIGWGTLIRQLFDDIRDTCKKHKSTIPLVAQVKSKFGRLCFYLDQDNQLDKNSLVGIELERLIRKAEIESGTICEITGLRGIAHVKDGWWYATLSDDMGKKLGYTKHRKKDEMKG